MPGDGRRSLLILALCVAPAPALAQRAPVMSLDEGQSRGEIAAGVSMQAPADVNQKPACEQLALPCLSPRTIGDFGLALSTTIYPTELVGIAGELSVYSNQWVANQPDCDHRHSICTVNETNRVAAAQIGVKVRTPVMTHGQARARFFGQVLAGPEVSDVGPTHRTIQPGGGYESYFSNGVGIRLEVDYRFVRADARNLSTSRFLAWLVIPLGT